jgi:3-polyprenyl-4-hydroxybenzoate decarboxylase
MELILKNVKKKDFPVLKSLAKSLGFEIVQEVEKTYNPEFVKEILEAREELKQGKGIKMTLEDIDKLWK